MLLKDKHIFIVEDNLQNRIIYQMILIKHGAQVYFERWGKDAIWRLHGLAHVHLIILDLALAGGISGYDIYDDIRKQPKFDAVPIVAVSATDPTIGIHTTQLKGFSGFIAKPINDSLFPEQLAHLLKGERVWYAGERSLG
jgi:CheY-like chemotaxis protein